MLYHVTFAVWILLCVSSQTSLSSSIFDSVCQKSDMSDSHSHIPGSGPSHHHRSTTSGCLVSTQLSRVTAARECLLTVLLLTVVAGLSAGLLGPHASWFKGRAECRERRQLFHVTEESADLSNVTDNGLMPNLLYIEEINDAPHVFGVIYPCI